jgi:gamma-F420-2:alpha-L-glutamate ligase
MGAGSNYFTLALVRHFERLGIHCISGSAAIEAAKDKLHTQQILAANNLPIPKTMLARFPVDPKLVERKLGFPLVVKSLSGSQGSGVFLADNRQTFEDLLNMIEAANPQATVILQEFIATSRGRDLRVFVIGGRAVACMLRQSQDDNFKANVSGGAKAKPYTLTPEIEWLATQTANALGLEIGGIDLLFDGEANSAPGFSAIESVCEVDIPREIFNYLQIRLGAFHPH